MCRLFMLWGTPNKEDSEHYINLFLQQTKKKQKDGFGFSWLPTNKKQTWQSYKSSLTYDKDPKIHDVIPKVAESNLIFGHLRLSSIHDTPSVTNNQPFVYKNHIFMHNGLIRHFDTDLSIRRKMKERIAPSFHSLIQGNTDSEYLFYLFLTIQLKYRGHRNIFGIQLNTVENHLEYSLQELLQIMQNDIGVDGIYNIIYSDQKHVLVCRRCSGYSHSPNMYLYKNADTMLISSGEPLENRAALRYRVVPEGVVWCFDI